MKRRLAKGSADKQTTLSLRRQANSSGLRSTRELRLMHRHNPSLRCGAGFRGQAVSAKKRDKKTMVSASELSQMGACERLVLFEAKHGKQTSRCQQEAIDLGRSEHAKFFGEGVRLQSDVQTSLSKPWCFCASLAWGREAPETALLRQFRDHILRRSATGRHLIWLYYRTAPGLCRQVEGNRTLIRALRVGLKPALWIARVVLAKQYYQRRRDN